MASANCTRSVTTTPHSPDSMEYASVMAAANTVASSGPTSNTAPNTLTIARHTHAIVMQFA